jgi:CheY-like chemotaxis protein/glutaredoxin
VTSDPTKIRVLFVEDAFDQALLVKAFLSSAEKFDVTHSQDGDKAAELLRSKDWDLFITDLNLPGVNGFELIRISKKAHPDLPVMATTGYTGAHYQEEAFRAGASDLMTKPLEREDFLDRVAKLVGTEEGSPPPPPPPQGSILAVGGMVGDAEMGCGASLAHWASQGKSVYILPMFGLDSDPDGLGIECARAAAPLLGATAILEDAALEDTTERVSLVKRLLQEHSPEVVYVPSEDDNHPARREAFRIVKAMSSSVPVILAYQTATTGAGFLPARFVDTADDLVAKMEALSAYQDCGRPDLAPRMAQAYARYWGRLEMFTEVEAFEVLKDA